MKSALRETVQTLALAAFIFLLLQSSLQNYRVEGSSMNPNLEDQQLVLVNKLIYLGAEVQRLGRLLPWVDGDEGERWYPFRPPERGDVIVFRSSIPPYEDFVKRVIGLPGDTVALNEGIVYINGAPLDEPYVINSFPERRNQIVVGPGLYYVLGDNRGRSDDSRHWGLVPEEDIIGRAWVGYWPLDRFGALFPSWHR